MPTPPPHPIRTALIGLSATATTSWASTAHLPYLLSPAGRQKYKITALCNSSTAAALDAIKHYNLPATTKAYGSPDELAGDEDVDFVVCCTRVDRHFETTVGCLRSGKDVFVEWPVAQARREMEEMCRAAGESRGRTLVGLQGRWAPVVLKVKEVLESGRLGRVLSGEVRAFGGTNDREVLPVGLKYFAERGVGGNPITIGFGHVIDFVQSVLGDLVPETTHATLQLQRPNLRIRDTTSNTIVETIRSDVPDLISLHGTLPASKTVTPSATLSVLFRRGQPFPGDPALTWSLNCEFGELRLVAPSGVALQAGAYDEPVTIRAHIFGPGGEVEKAEEVEWDWSEAQKVIPVRGRSVASVYEAFAEGRREGWVGIEEAVARARQIEGWLAGFAG